jgi:predicted kinase
MDCLNKEALFSRLPSLKHAKHTVFIMRGLPGSGKSTLVKEIHSFYWNGVGNPLVASADDYFMVDGEYRYDRSKIGDAHKWCMQRFLENLKDVGPYFVDNTNITIEELRKYVVLAKAYSSFVYIITLDIDIETSLKRNKHNVPKSVIEKMYAKVLDADADDKLVHFLETQASRIQHVRHLRLVTI